MRLKHFLATGLMLTAISLSAHALNDADQTTIVISNPTTNEPQTITLRDSQDADVMRQFVPQLEGMDQIFNIYVEKGYAPFHAYLLTSAELISILREVSSSVPPNPELDKQIASILDLYQPR